MFVISLTFPNPEEEGDKEELLHIQMFVVELQLSKCPSGKVSPTNRSHKTNKSDKLSLMANQNEHLSKELVTSYSIILHQLAILAILTKYPISI